MDWDFVAVIQHCHLFELLLQQNVDVVLVEKSKCYH